MRTMFISLILISSLAQLASTEDPPPPSTRFLPEGCGTIYQCYVPGICIPADVAGVVQENADLSKLETQDVFLLTKDKKITSDCPALIKFHPFSYYVLYVHIESFQESNTINSIEFHHAGQKAQFFCSIEDKKVLGKYGKIVKENNVEKFVVFEKTKNDLILDTDKINCSFYVRQRSGNADNKIFFEGIKDNIFKVNMKSTRRTSIVSIIFERCDPSMFDFNDVEDKEKIYREVEYNFKENKLHCKDSKNSMIEFVGKGKTKYEEMDKFECENTNFFIKDKKDTIPFDDQGRPNSVYMFDLGDDIQIRCVEEVRYLCNENVKVSRNGEPPLIKQPDYGAKTPTALNCPPGKPHLIIEEGGEDPVLNAKFECRKYGDTAYWTVATSDKRTIRLTEEGPPVYCSETVQCKIFFTIPDNAVEEGFIGKDDLPKCLDASGTLKVGEQVVTNTRCDGKDGKFKYTAGGPEEVIDENTKFVCTYPPNKEEAAVQNQKNKDTITAGIAGTIGGSLVLVIAGLSICGFLTMRRRKKDKQFLVDYGNAERLQWGSKSEKEAAKRARDLKNKNNPSSLSSDNESMFNKWNELIASVVHTFRTTAFTRPELVVFTKTIRTDVTGKNAKKYAVHKACERKVIAEESPVAAHKKVFKDAPAKAKGGVTTGLNIRTKKLKDTEKAEKKNKEREAGKK